MPAFNEVLVINAFLKTAFPKLSNKLWITRTTEDVNLQKAVKQVFDSWEPKPLPSYILMKLLKESLVFTSTSQEILPAFISLNEENLAAAIEHQKEISSYHRYTNFLDRKIIPAKGKDEEEFETLKIDVLRQIKKILSDNWPKSMKITGNLRANDLNAAILYCEKGLTKDPALRGLLVFLNDYKKILFLKPISITQKDGTTSSFCRLSEKAGGVTEKYSLISLASAKEKLEALQQLAPDTLENYDKNRANYELSIEAIIKLPKKGQTIEVQREAIALNMSRILNLETTDSSMVNFNGKAALFVPFDKITLMKDLAKGQTLTSFIPSSLKKLNITSYLHYSLIAPLGNALKNNQLVSNFAKALGFVWLCNDPDFMGAFNQNKALKNNKDLYIFDQVFTPQDKWELDTRFSMVPIGIKRHSRHNQGRNRSIIEDSPLDKKFDSIIELFKKRKDLVAMIETIIYHHAAQLKTLKAKKPLNKETKEAITELSILYKDAILIKRTLDKRMNTIFKNFPTFNGKKLSEENFIQHEKLLKKVFLLEKLINKPALFTKDGRPYRYPWTYRNTHKLNRLALTKDGKLSIGYSEKDKERLIFCLKNCGVDLSSAQWQRFPRRKLILPAIELNKISESNLFPELEDFNEKTNYLANLDYITSAYPPIKQSKKVATLIKEFSDILPLKHSRFEQITTMKESLKQLHTLLQTEPNQGYLKHVEIKLQLEIQKKIRQWVHLYAAEATEDLKKAYEVSVNLDRLNEFNLVVLELTKDLRPEENKANFRQYLSFCINCGKQSNTPHLLQRASQKFLKGSNSILNKEKQADQLNKIQEEAELKLDKAPEKPEPAPSFKASEESPEPPPSSQSPEEQPESPHPFRAH